MTEARSNGRCRHEPLVSRRWLLRSAALGSAGLAATTFIGCKGAEGPTSVTLQATGEPRRGGILRVWESQEPASWDTYLNFSGVYCNYVSFLYPKLTKFTAGPNIKPNQYSVDLDLADRMEQPDEQTYIFHLHEPAVWQDVAPLNGRPVVAQDVVYNIQLWNEKGINRGLTAPHIDAVQAIDQHTVHFRLKRPLYTFPMYIGHTGGPFLYPPELKETDATREKTAAAGAFLLEGYDVGTTVRYIRNPRYYKAPLPYVDGVTISVIRDPSTAVANLRSRQIDLTYSYLATVPAEEVPSLKRALPGVTWVEAEFPPITGLTADIGDPRFKDERVRQAISVAIDREGLLQIQGGGSSYMSPFGPLEYWWLDPKKDPALRPYYTRDVQRAKQLLAAAGFPSGLTDLTYYFQATSTQQRMAELARANLREAGIEIRLHPQEYAEWRATSANGRHFGALAPAAAHFCTDPDEGLSLVFDPDSPRSPIPNRELLREDKKLMDLKEQIRYELNRERRKALVDEVQKHLSQKMYVIGTVAAVHHYFAQQRVKNMHWVIHYAYGPIVAQTWLES